MFTIKKIARKIRSAFPSSCSPQAPRSRRGWPKALYPRAFCFLNTGCVCTRRRKPRVAKEGGWIDVCPGCRAISHAVACLIREKSRLLVNEETFLVASLFSCPLPFLSRAISAPNSPPPSFSRNAFSLHSFARLIQISRSTKYFFRQFLSSRQALSQFFTFYISSPRVIIHNSHFASTSFIFSTLTPLSCPCSNFSILVSFQGNILLLLLQFFHSTPPLLLSLLRFNHLTSFFSPTHPAYTPSIPAPLNFLPALPLHTTFNTTFA